MNTPLTFHCPSDWIDGAINITVIGCGGTGSEVVDGLSRLHHALIHLGHPRGLELTLWDGDEVSETNIGRQRFAPSDVGMNKAEVLARRYGMIFGQRISWAERAFGEDDLSDLAADLVITATDKASFRAWLGDALDHIGSHGDYAPMLWADTGNGDMTGQVVMGHAWKAGESWLPNVMDLFPGIRQMPDDDAPSCSMEEALRSQAFGVNRWSADCLMSMLWRLLRHGSIQQHGATFDLSAMRVSPIMIDPVGWSLYGYESPLLDRAA